MTWPFILGVVLSAFALIPVLFLTKVEKQKKRSIAVRLFILMLLITQAALLLSFCLTQKNLLKYFGSTIIIITAVLVIAAVIMLRLTARYCAKTLPLGRCKLLFISVLALGFAIRGYVLFTDPVDGGYTLNGINMVYLFFVALGLLMGGIVFATPGSSHAVNPPANHNNVSNDSWALATKSQIDAEIALKGKSVLLDPNLDLLEQKRFRDALAEKDADYY